MNKLKRRGRDALIFALLVGGLMLVMDRFRAPQAPNAFASQPLHTLDGLPVTLEMLSADRPLLVYFWASWCSICRITTPTVADIAQQGGNVISVALRSGEDAKVQRYLRAKQYQLMTVNDEKGLLSANWQIGVTPTLVVIDKGKVVSSTTGWTSGWGIKLRLWWAAHKA